ncbi:SAM hydrolase/SAM-dependent halogenase family protein [Gloeobacter violaceus]|uniref:Gll1881 protein n=1 Tax=Gloeobacter violaceus (strain ATCC 29082 / PCC 7421) TaxID=251221 RepID=Q7NJF1_GLOVI|nr:SAM-dependent chlorinase/fluorinase [Gloeobacter violaceus]BAC89822.1 gll1881 [Gloeobacter violaceus PCC 7421]
MLIHLIADYGNGDSAFSEVAQRLMLHTGEAQILPVSVPPFSTLATGFWVAQLGLNPSPPDMLIYHNCAPRKDDVQPRADNEGEGLVYALLPGGIRTVGVNAGYTLSFIKDSALALHWVNVARAGSQFRSRDIFPVAAAKIAAGDESLLGNPLERDRLPDLPADRIAWVDGYGNLKTTIAHSSLALEVGTKLVLRVGDAVSDAVYSDGSFRVPEGTLAFAPGSSGWNDPDGTPIRWMELFLRGGSAWQRFGRPKLEEKVTILAR